MHFSVLTPFGRPTFIVENSPHDKTSILLDERQFCEPFPFSLSLDLSILLSLYVLKNKLVDDDGGPSEKRNYVGQISKELRETERHHAESFFHFRGEREREREDDGETSMHGK